MNDRDRCVLFKGDVVYTLCIFFHGEDNPFTVVFSDYNEWFSYCAHLDDNFNSLNIRSIEYTKSLFNCNVEEIRNLGSLS